MGFDNVVNLGDLSGDFVSGGFIFRDDESELPFITDKDVLDLVGDDFAGDVGAEEAFKAKDRFNTGDGFEFGGDGESFGFGESSTC